MEPPKSVLRNLSLEVMRLKANEGNLNPDYFVSQTEPESKTDFLFFSE